VANSGGEEGVMSTHSEETARELLGNPDLRHFEDPAKELPKVGQAPTLAKAAPTAVNRVIRWLRWAFVLALVYYAWGGLTYSALGGPAPLAVVLHHVDMLHYHTLREAAFVVAGAMIAPRVRRTTAIVLAAARVSFSFWAHVLATGGPWWFWTINDTHFFLEAFGSVLGVVFIFWLEKANVSVASVPRKPPPP
jgi:hypothetical protein